MHINAHGGGLLKDGEVWYWYGVHKVERKAGNRAQVGVGCYSSRDLVTWKNEGIALKVSNEEGHDIEKDCILERPKVVKAPATGKYVMLFHLERKGRGYNDARVGIAVADKPGLLTIVFNFRYTIHSSFSWRRFLPQGKRNKKGKNNGSIRSTRIRRQADACQGR